MDTIKFDIKLDFSKKLKNHKIQPTLKADDIPNKIPDVLTKRMVMSQLNGIYDPLGLLVPFTIRGKILLRDLWAKGYDWDTPLLLEEHQKWVEFFTEMLQVPILSFPRSVQPSDTIGKPILVTFSDGSKEAFGCCCYIRWQIADGSFRSFLITSKSRVAPLKTTTIVRLELSAAVLATRLRSFVEDSFRLKFEKVIHIVDSQIVRAMINKDSYGFNTFVATRVGEIQTTTSPQEWYWIESKLNAADIISRGAAAGELNVDSTWQRGPDFLMLPVEQWPIHQDFNLPEELPEKSGYVFSSTATIKSNAIIDINRFSDYIRLIRVTARILCLRRVDPKHSLSNLNTSLTPSHLEDAKSYWVKDSQTLIQEELEKGMNGKGSFRKLSVKMVEGVYVAAGRIEAWNELTYGNSNLIILPRDHRYSQLFARHIHENAHTGVNADVAKIRSHYWIIGIQKLVKSIRYNCITCRKFHGKLQEQIMAPLPIERLKPAPMWHNTGLDLFGPFLIKGEVNKRSVGKGYAVIFTCLLTRAVFIDIATDYSTDGFLIVFRRFVSIRGYPAKIFSDPGSQLTSASKELNEMFRHFDWEKIKDIGAGNGLEWKFSPAEAPWYNGCSEALIRSIKKSVSHAIGTQKITFTEMQTVLYESANIVNERPIGATPKSVEDGTYLCPNDMILGRSSNKVPAGEFDLTVNSRRRLYFVQRLIDAVWKKWTCCYFPSLLERPKWHHARRNMQVDDLVIVQDKALRRNQWKLGKVSEVFIGTDEKVRHVKLKYINPSTGTATEVERPVQKLVVILAADEVINDDTASSLTANCNAFYRFLGAECSD